MGLNEFIQFFKNFSGKLPPNLYLGMQSPSTMQQMAFIKNLQREARQKNDLDLPLNELKVVVFDLETTGFHPERGDQVISIGAIKMTGWKIEEADTFYSLVKTELPLSAEITALTNIHSEQLQQAADASEVVMNFFQFMNHNILVAHHSHHEKSFMQKLTWDLLRIRFEQRIIDTSFLIRLFHPSLTTWPLEEVCKDCGIEVKNRHHALGDAITTAQIWSHYLQKAHVQGYKTLREIYEYLSKLR